MKDTGKTTIWVVIISLFSKLLTLASNTMYLSIFGSGNPLINVYSYALQFPNTIFNCVGTTLNTVIIPIYTSLLAKEDKDSAKKFLDDIISVSTLIILALILIGILCAPLIASLASSKVDSQYVDYLVFALRILMPVMLFYGLNYIFQGVLQSHGHFKLPAFVSAPSSLAIIFYLIFFAKTGGVTGLIIATIVGLGLQPLIMLPSLKKIGYRYKVSLDFKSPQIRTAAKLTLPVLASVSSYQINFFFNNTMAFRMGTAPIMSYSQTLVQTFMLTIVYAISSVYFPKLTRQWASNLKEEFRDTLNEIFQTVIFIILPAACGFWLLRYDIMNLLLNWKNDASADIFLAGNMLGIYSVGIVAISLKEVLDKAFYAGKDTKTPAIFGFIIMIVNICVTLLLINRLGTYSMPIAYAFSAFCGMLGLMYKINNQVNIVNKPFLITAIKCAFAALIMSVIVKCIIFAVADLYIISTVITKLLKLIIPAACGGCVYMLAAYLLKIPAFHIFAANWRDR